MRVELRDEAIDDLVDGALFYGRQAPGLDVRFIECLREDLRTLEREQAFTRRTADSVASFPNGSLTPSTISSRARS